MLELEGEPAALGRLRLGVRELVPGGGEGHLRPVLGGDVLVGAAHRVQAAPVVEDGLRDETDVPGDAVGALEPEVNRGFAPVVQERAQEAVDGGHVVRVGVGAQLLQGDGEEVRGRP